MEKLYKGLFIKRLTELMETHPNYSIGECLYSIFRKECLKQKPNEAKTSWLLNISDRDFYGAAEHSINIEKE